MPMMPGSSIDSAATTGAEELERRRPTSPGEVLRKEILGDSGITQEQLADAMRVSRYTVNQLINERRCVTAKTALRLGKATSTSPELWLNLQRAVDLYDARQELARELDQVEVVLRPTAEQELFYDLPDEGQASEGPG